MKRYKWIHLFSISSKGFDGSVGYIKENPNGDESYDSGEYVTWEEHKEEIFRFTEIYEKRIRELKARIGQECNCEEMANKPDYEDHPDGLSPLPIILPPFWICPAHGYKRRL